MIVKIDALDHNGRGITKVNNKITFVNNALPGELVDIIITKEKKNFNEAKSIKIIEKSPDRIEPICSYYNECGGCDIMHMNYEASLNFKKDKVINIIKKYASLDIDPIIYKSNKQFNYRNKITLHNKNNILGYMKKGTNEIIKIDSCPLAMNSINDYLKNITEFKKENFIIRTNEQGSIISTLKDEKIIIEINDFKFQVDINSFFQVNNYICSCIFDFIEQNLDSSNICLDLYCGVGTLSLLASKKSSLVYGIEINESSYKNALKNLELNNIKNVNFILGNVKDKIKNIKEKIDVIITDPPRVGMDESCLEVIENIKPKKIIYMSCNPITLARDLNILKNNYIIDGFAIFDMFPNTSHVECVCVLNRV